MMMRANLLLLLTVLVLGCGAICDSMLSPRQRLDTQLDAQWLAFKQSFNKQYDEVVEYYRRGIWEENVRYIQQHNLQHDMGLHTYTLGINQFADLTHAEFIQQKLGLKMLKSAEIAEGRPTFLPPLNVHSLPSTVDWRTKGYVTPVKNQEQCGSCWAFSTTGSLEGQYFRAHGNLLSFSEQQLVDCSGKFGNQGCNGGLMTSAFKYIKESGIELESYYPYTARDGNCHYDASHVATKVSNYVQIKQKNETDLKSAVATVGPISVAIDASHLSFQFYKKGVYNERRCSQTRLDHGVLAVGYGTDSKGGDYWLVKNSWGSSWGQEGYIMMTRNRENQCGIATDASYPIM